MMQLQLSQDMPSSFFLNVTTEGLLPITLVDIILLYSEGILSYICICVFFVCVTLMSTFWAASPDKSVMQSFPHSLAQKTASVLLYIA